MRFGWKLPIALLVLSACLLITGGKGLVVGLLPAENLDDPSVDWGSLKANQHVKVENICTDGYFYYYTEDNVEKARRYAIIDIVNYEGEDYLAYYMGFNAQKEDFSKLDSSAEATNEWLCGDSNIPDYTYVGRDGYLRKMKKDEIDALREWISELGWPDEDVEDALVPYIIMENQSQLTNVLMFAGGLLLLVGGVALVILNVKNRD